MNDGILSQEEIDALLRGDNPVASEEPATLLSDFEKDTLGEIGNISMGTAATTLSTLLRKKVSITTPEVEICDRRTFGDRYVMPYVVVDVQYRQGLTGANVLVIKEQDAAIIADLMMGGEGEVASDFAVNEIMLSAVGEAMNQMVGSATTSLSSMFNQRIDIAPPKVLVAELGQEILKIPSDFNDLISIRFKMEIEGLVNSECMQIIPMEAVRDMIKMAMGTGEPEMNLDSILSSPVSPPPSVAEIPPPIFSEPPPIYEPLAAEPAFAPANDFMSRPAASSPAIKKDPQFTVQPVQFVPLNTMASAGTAQNIGLIMDVPLDVSVELGKARKTIKEILELQQGSVIQLDKMAGEPVDLLVNGKLIAKGEVVVIDENYGIRITTIISPMDRVSRLQ